MSLDVPNQLDQLLAARARLRQALESDAGWPLLHGAGAEADAAPVISHPLYLAILRLDEAIAALSAMALPNLQDGTAGSIPVDDVQEWIRADADDFVRFDTPEAALLATTPAAGLDGGETFPGGGLQDTAAPMMDARDLFASPELEGEPPSPPLPPRQAPARQSLVDRLRVLDVHNLTADGQDAPRTAEVSALRPHLHPVPSTGARISARNEGSRPSLHVVVADEAEDEASVTIVPQEGTDGPSHVPLPVAETGEFVPARDAEEAEVVIFRPGGSVSAPASLRP